MLLSRGVRMTVPRLRAPAGDGELLIHPPLESVDSLLRSNRSRIGPAHVFSQSLADLRRSLRQELGLPTDQPLIVTGHQPELWHPGVWAKTFAASGLAERCSGTAVNLIVDNDTVKSVAVHLPVMHGDPVHTRWAAVPFDRMEEERPYESRYVLDDELFHTLPQALAKLTGPQERVIDELWPTVVAAAGTLGDRLTAGRRKQEAEWGCRITDVNVRVLSQTSVFQKFANALIDDAERFRAIHNQAVHAYRRRHRLRSQTHPVPDLAPGEVPFWTITSDGLRRRWTDPGQPIRPRALTLTLFARLFLADLFIHGLGGGLYDEVTDDIIRDWLGLEPPDYLIVTGTLLLPGPRFPDADAEFHRLTHRIRDRQTNPQRHLTNPSPEVLKLIQERETLTAQKPGSKSDRRERRLALRRINDQLRPLVPSDNSLEELRQRTRTQAEAHAVLTRRDYPAVLAPERTLKPFLMAIQSRCTR